MADKSPNGESTSGCASDTVLMSGDCPRFLYMFINCMSNDILYKIDVRKYLENPPNDEAEIEELCPLLVFPIDTLTHCTTCTLLGSDLYFVGTGIFKTIVSKISTFDLINLTPSEDNDYTHYCSNVEDMHGCKINPTVFAARGNFYVLSNTGHSMQSPDYRFEVYSPETSTWRILQCLPKFNGVESFLVVDDKVVYFTTSYYTITCFDLVEETWKDFVSPADWNTPNNLELPFNPLSIFSSSLQIFGDMIFGLSENNPSFVTICASFKSSDQKFMRPFLAPDDNFMRAWFDDKKKHMVDNICYPYDRGYTSDYLINLGQNILCVISYGSKPHRDRVNFVCDPYKAVAALNFFKVSDGFHTSRRVRRNVRRGNPTHLYAEEVDGDHVIRRHFYADFLHHQHFIIPTKKYTTDGHIQSCSYT